MLLKSLLLLNEILLFGYKKLRWLIPGIIEESGIKTLLCQNIIVMKIKYFNKNKLRFSLLKYPNSNIADFVKLS